MMRNRERAMLEEVGNKINESADVVATLLEGRDDEEGGVGYDLRILYTNLLSMIDDVDEISYEL
jgi:hypothetical protein